jgi:hypothetical protein
MTMIKAIDVPVQAEQSVSRRWLQLVGPKLHLPEAEFQAWRSQPEVAALEAQYREASGLSPIGLRRGVVGSDVT